MYLYSASCAHVDDVCAFCYTIDLDHTPDHVVPFTCHCVNSVDILLMG